MKHCYFIFYCHPAFLHKAILLHQCIISRRVNVCFLVPTKLLKDNLTRVLWQTTILAKSVIRSLLAL